MAKLCMKCGEKLSFLSTILDADSKVCKKCKDEVQKPTLDKRIFCPECELHQVEISSWPSFGNRIPYKICTNKGAKKYPKALKIGFWCSVCSETTGYVVWDDWPGRVMYEKNPKEWYVPNLLRGRDGKCSDGNCPCPETAILIGHGYMYVNINPDRSLANGDRVTAILICEQGAKLRGLDLDIAAKDAAVWWDTSRVPYRSTPITPEEQKKRLYLQQKQEQSKIDKKKYKIQKITNIRELEYIAKKGSSIDLRNAAEARLKILRETQNNGADEFSGKLPPGLKHTDWRIRLQEIKKIKDQDVLVWASKTDMNSSVRDEAMSRLDNQQAFLGIIQKTKDGAIVKQALSHIRDVKILADLAKNSDNGEARSIAVGKLTDQEILGEVASNGIFPGTCRMAISRLTDQQVLVRITKTITDKKTIQAAKTRLFNLENA